MNVYNEPLRTYVRTTVQLACYAYDMLHFKEAKLLDLLCQLLLVCNHNYVFGHTILSSDDFELDKCVFIYLFPMRLCSRQYR